MEGSKLYQQRLLNGAVSYIFNISYKKGQVNLRSSLFHETLVDFLYKNPVEKPIFTMNFFADTLINPSVECVCHFTGKILTLKRFG
jgi:hypothetical protein